MIQSCSFDFLEKQEGLVFHNSIAIFGSDSSNFSKIVTKLGRLRKYLVIVKPLKQQRK